MVSSKWRLAIALVLSLLLTSLTMAVLQLLLIPDPLLALPNLMQQGLLSFTYLLLWVLPLLWWARRRQRASIWLSVSAAAIAALVLGIIQFVLADWGTHGFTTAGEAGYRTVEAGRLTAAGRWIWVIRILFGAAEGALSGAVFSGLGARRLATP